MNETAEKQREQPSYAAMSEEYAAKKLFEAIRAWREAGKPHKR